MFTRYAVYFTPSGALADFGAHWLGWDVSRGTPCPHPTGTGLDIAALTRTPRKYGMHGTIKPPFRLNHETDIDGLQTALADLCSTLAPVFLDRLNISRIGRFLALIPDGDTSHLADLAARAVSDLDMFRAPPSDAELAKRRKARLTPAQDQHLLKWGYPYVMDQFRFHITLTGPLEPATAQDVMAALTPMIAPVLPVPFVIDSLTLAGEDTDGFFHEIHRYTLTG